MQQAKSTAEDNDELHDSIKILKELLQQQTQRAELAESTGLDLTARLQSKGQEAKELGTRLRAALDENANKDTVMINDRNIANTEVDRLRAIIADMTIKLGEGQQRL